MKKILVSLLLCAAMLLGSFALSGCGGYDPYKQLYYYENEDGTYTVSGVFSSSMTEQHIPATFKDGKPVVGIEGDAFARCKELAVVTLPETLLWIGADLMWGTEYYRTAENWQNDILYVGQYAISAKDVKSLTVKEGTRLLADEFGRNQDGIEEISLPESLIYVGFLPFYECGALSRITVAAGNDMYYSEGGCLIERATQKVVLAANGAVLPDDGSIRVIDSHAFASRASLTSLEIPEGVVSIGMNAFENCGALTTLTIPATVTELGADAFYGCDKLARISFGGTMAEWRAMENGRTSLRGLCEVSCSDGVIS